METMTLARHNHPDGAAPVVNLYGADRAVRFDFINRLPPGVGLRRATLVVDNSTHDMRHPVRAGWVSVYGSAVMFLLQGGAQGSLHPATLEAETETGDVLGCELFIRVRAGMRQPSTRVPYAALDYVLPPAPIIADGGWLADEKGRHLMAPFFMTIPIAPNATRIGCHFLTDEDNIPLINGDIP